MLQKDAHPGRPQRPIHEEVHKLSDAQLSMMCHNYRIFPGAITFRNRRQAERQLHIALIEERARHRARQQFAEELRQEHSEDPNFRPGPPPPQQHYDFRAALPPPAAPAPHYWPVARTVNMRINPPPSSTFQYRQEPVLEPHRYVSWQQQNRINKKATQQSFQRPVEVQASDEGTELNFLGFTLPFTLETARDITNKIGETLKRFQAVGDSQAATRFEGGSQGKYEVRNTENVAHHQTHQSSYQTSTMSERSQDASEEEYQEDISIGEGLEMPHENDRDTLFDYLQDDSVLQTYAPSVSKVKTLADAQAQTELVENSSSVSTATTYHDFFSHEPLKKAAGHSWWSWWPKRAMAGDERIPVAEQTREREHKHEHEVKSIDYLSDSTLHADDGVLELMPRVELRDDSEEEDLVVLPDGSLSTQPSPRSYAGFCGSIFRFLLCDRDAKLDPEKLRAAFLGCCMAFAIYMGFRMIR
ncbi:hypothetical protein KR200_004110 [Drosophila serrata]|nr:hypothetical protein KR200_004110 [Drosophila serrata]